MQYDKFLRCLGSVTSCIFQRRRSSCIDDLNFLRLKVAPVADRVGLTVQRRGELGDRRADILDDCVRVQKHWSPWLFVTPPFWRQQPTPEDCVCLLFISRHSCMQQKISLSGLFDMNCLNWSGKWVGVGRKVCELELSAGAALGDT